MQSAVEVVRAAQGREDWKQRGEDSTVFLWSLYTMGKKKKENTIIFIRTRKIEVQAGCS